MPNIYRTWGFKSNPFAQTPLPATEEGKELLIGRTEEVTRILTRLNSPPKLVTVEGSNGVGKTSIINVAAHVAYQDFLEDASNPLYLPCQTTFQLDSKKDPSDFVREAFLGVALTLTKAADSLEEMGYSTPGIAKLKDWLTSPILTAINGMLTAWNFGGLGAGKADSVNTSSGFSEAGFEDAVRQLLVQVFADNEAGGIVCTVDNMELLRTSEAARSAIEALRDDLFTTPGLRWVLCGATGIVRGLASTPRMNGYLHAPVDVGDIKVELAGEILESRVKVFGITDATFLPVSAEEFEILFSILHGNVRDALSTADEYCMHVFENDESIDNDKTRRAAFSKWIKRECEQRLNAAEEFVAPRAWELFDAIVEGGGQCSPGDYERFNFNSQQAMRSQVLSLENSSLIQSVRDDEDNRRKTILVTPSGWMVHFARTKGLGGLYEGSVA